MDAEQLANARMLAMNAISFEADWEDEFMKHATEKQTFYVAPGVEKEVTTSNSCLHPAEGKVLTVQCREEP